MFADLSTVGCFRVKSGYGGVGGKDAVRCGLAPREAMAGDACSRIRV